MPGETVTEGKKPEGDEGYFEEMTKAVFRSGFSWKVVENKWPNFQSAFEGFSIEKVAAFDEADVERLLGDPGIVRNGRKVESTLHNARAFLEIQDKFGTFHDYLRSMDGEDYSKIAKDLRERFKHIGRTGTFTFLWSVGEDVPEWEDR